MTKMQGLSKLVCLAAFAMSITTGQSVQAATAPARTPGFLVAADGKPKAPIVVSPKAGESSRASAAMLAGFLQRITGAVFAIQAGDGTRGIAVGTAGEFPRLTASLKLPSPTAGHLPTAQQRYRLRSHSQGLQLIGASELAVEYAVWDLLHRLGFRQFLPGPAWEIVPRVAAPTISVDVLEEPDYYDRRISTISVDEDVAEWTLRNRLSWHDAPPAFNFRKEMPRKYLQSMINTGHAYSYIVRDYKEEFDRHPEWLALVDGKRGSSTFFCISNPGLRAFVAKWAVDYFEKYPDAWSVSLEPTDGARLCECEACAKLANGRISNLVVLLANEAAQAITARYPDRQKYVGLLGYGYHWQPPTIPVHERVVVQVTSQTLSPTPGPFPPMDERLAGWAKQARHIGAYEYLSLVDWGGWLPAVSAGSNTGYLTDIVPQYHRRGARIWLAEASESWGSSALGYYLVSRMLWDVKEGERAEAIRTDFLTKSFGSAKESMREFFSAADGRHRVAPGNFNQVQARVDKMYPPLLRALRETNDRAARTRIEHFLLYTRFVDLYARLARLQKKKELNIEAISQDDVRRAAVDMLRHAYRMRRTHMLPWDILASGWFRAYKVDPAELMAPGGSEAQQVTGEEIARIVSDVTPRYAAAPPVRSTGRKGPTIRHGDTVLFDGEGFDVAATAVLPTNLTPTVSKPEHAKLLRTPAGNREPGPAAGSGYLRLVREVGETNVRTRFEARKDGRIVAEWMAHGDPRGDGENAMHFLLAQGSREHVGLITKITGNVFYLRDGQYVDTGLHYNGAQWQLWRLAYSPETGLFDLTIGDKTKTGLQGIAGPVDNFMFRCGQNDTTFYIDGAG